MQYYNVRGLADKMGRPYAEIWRAIQAGITIPAVQAGHSRLFTDQNIKELAEYFAFNENVKKERAAFDKKFAERLGKATDKLAKQCKDGREITDAIDKVRKDRAEEERKARGGK